METINLNLMKVDTPSSHIQSIPAALGFQPENKVVFTVCDESEATEIRIWDVPVNWVEVLEEIRNSYSGSSLSGILLVYSQKAHELLSFSSQVHDLLKNLEGSVNIKDAFQVSENRYWSYMCEGCCDPAGKEIPMTKKIVVNWELAEATWNVLNQLVELPENHVLEAEETLLLCEAVQDVQIRDFILGRLAVAETNQDKYLDVLKQVAQKANEDQLPRVSGMLAALQMAFKCEAKDIQESLKAAENDSLGTLVSMALESGFSSESLISVFKEASEKQEQTK